MGIPERPTTVIVTGSGDIPVDHRGLNDPTVPSSSRRRRPARSACDVPVSPTTSRSNRSAPTADHGNDLVALGRRHGARLILTEGGPHLLGEVVGSDVLDELFLTWRRRSWARVGRSPGLVEGIALPPSDAPWFELASLRRSADHLFIRYHAKEA
jgi:riboflavin biosynthesis pyrimidine reductase